MERFRIVYSTPAGEPGETYHDGNEAELRDVIEGIEDMGTLHAVESLGPIDESDREDDEHEDDESSDDEPKDDESKDEESNDDEPKDEESKDDESKEEPKEESETTSRRRRRGRRDN